MNLRARRLSARRVVAAAAGCGALAAVPACHIPPPRQPESVPVLPADFRGAATPDNSAALRVEEVFNDPVLTSLITQALAGNQELKILAEDVRIANYEVLARRGALFPFVALRTNAAVERTSPFTRFGAVDEALDIRPGRRIPNPLPNFMYAADITWQVDIWRKLRNARDAAALRYLATGEGRRYTVTRLVAEVADNYYNLLALDQRLAVLDNTIAIQQQSLEFARANKEAGKGTELPVQRFEAEIKRNQSEKLIVRQEVVEAENRINFLSGRFPQPVERPAVPFVDLNLRALSVGVPSELLRNRPDIREAERELEAAGLDVTVAKAEFYPSLVITSGVGFEAFNLKYLFMPEAFAANVVGGLTAPLVNRTAVLAVYGTANARQLQAVYNYQRVVLDAFTEVVNRVSAAQNYAQSVEVKKQQLAALEGAVESARSLYRAAKAEYIEVLFAQRDLLEARTVLIDTKRRQLSAVVNAYQALGGGGYLLPSFDGPPGVPVAPPGLVAPPAGLPVPAVPAVPPPGAPANGPPPAPPRP